MLTQKSSLSLNDLRLEVTSTSEAAIPRTAEE